MASTNKTANYELSQFIETDRPAWLTDYNGDMRKLDAALKAVSDVASGASGSISELADRMSTAEGNITTNTNDIDALEARADALEAQAQSTAGTIANIQTEQTAQNLGIEAATELGYNLARPYDSASTYAVGAYVLFQNTLYKCTTAVSTGETFDPSKWLAIKVTDEIADGESTVRFYDSTQKLFNIAINSSNYSGTVDTQNNETAYILGDMKIVTFRLNLSLSTTTADSSHQVSFRITWNDSRFTPTVFGEYQALSRYHLKGSSNVAFIANAYLRPTGSQPNQTTLTTQLACDTSTTSINGSLVLSFIYK